MCDQSVNYPALTSRLKIIPGDPELETHLERILADMNWFPGSPLSFRGRKGMRRPGPLSPRPSGGIPPRANRGRTACRPDILNHVEDRGLGVIGDGLEEVRSMSMRSA